MRFTMHTTLRTGILAVTMALAACGGSPESANSAATGAGAPADAALITDTATFSAQAVEIAGFTIDTVAMQPWQAVTMVPGRLMLDPQALETIGSITEGRITKVMARVGDRVRAGQVLVAIHSHEIMDARSALSQATAQVTAAAAERDLAVTGAERAKRLFEAKAMARADVERADVARQVAAAAYERAVAERARATALVDHLAGLGPTPAGLDEHEVLIRTPISGVVTARDAQPGTVVLPGTPLVTVGDPTRLQLQMRVPEAQAVGMQAGSRVRFALTDAPDVRVDAVVTRVAPTVDTLTRTIEVLAQPRGRSVGRAESFVQAEVLGKGTAPTLTVPSLAVQAMNGDTVVFVAERQGAGVFVAATPVRVGRRTTERVEILAGLKSGATVIVRGAAIAKAEVLKRRMAGEE